MVAVRDGRPGSPTASSQESSISMGPGYSRWARTPSPRNRDRAILSLGGVCLDSVCDWWLDSFESSPYVTLSRGAFSASSLVTPIGAEASRDRVVPVCNTDWSLPTPPHTASGRPADRALSTPACNYGQSAARPTRASRVLAGERVRAEENQGERSPRCAGLFGPRA